MERDRNNDVYDARKHGEMASCSSRMYAHEIMPVYPGHKID